MVKNIVYNRAPLSFPSTTFFPTYPHPFSIMHLNSRFISSLSFSQNVHNPPLPNISFTSYSLSFSANLAYSCFPSLFIHAKSMLRCTSNQNVEKQQSFTVTTFSTLDLLHVMLPCLKNTHPRSLHSFYLFALSLCLSVCLFVLSLYLSITLPLSVALVHSSPSSSPLYYYRSSVSVFISPSFPPVLLLSLSPPPLFLSILLLVFNGPLCFSFD